MTEGALLAVVAGVAPATVDAVPGVAAVVLEAAGVALGEFEAAGVALVEVAVVLVVAVGAADSREHEQSATEASTAGRSSSFG